MLAVVWGKVCGCSACGLGADIVRCSVLSRAHCLGLAEGFTGQFMSRYDLGAHFNGSVHQEHQKVLKS